MIAWMSGMYELPHSSGVAPVPPIELSISCGLVWL